eukprot:9689138-Alexandrium_andersonii.AAC.1
MLAPQQPPGMVEASWKCGLQQQPLGFLVDLPHSCRIVRMLVCSGLPRPAAPEPDPKPWHS